MVAAHSCSCLDIAQPPLPQFMRLLGLNDRFINADWDVTLGFSSGRLRAVGTASNRDGNNRLPSRYTRGSKSPEDLLQWMKIITFLFSSWLRSCPAVIPIPRD